HAASFALLAYASAWLKFHYLAAFTAALLNNQPMGFYSPATIVKDAQRHRLKVLAVDVMKSDWNCTLEDYVARAPLSAKPPALRLGLRFVRGLREQAGQALVSVRNRAPFSSIHDLIHRVPELRRDELNTLAAIGALNFIAPRRYRDTKEINEDFSVPLGLRGQHNLHRRDALWQVERAVRHSGPLVDELPEPDTKS